MDLSATTDNNQQQHTTTKNEMSDSLKLLQYLLGVIKEIGVIYLEFWKYAFKITGRATWVDYWGPVGLHYIFIPRLLKYLDSIIPLTIKTNDTHFNVIPCIVWLILMVPTFTCGVRRLHDMNYRGFWNVFTLIFPLSLAGFNLSPIGTFNAQSPSIIGVIGTLIFGILLFQCIVVTFVKLGLGTKGPNRYGPAYRDYNHSQTNIQ